MGGAWRQLEGGSSPGLNPLRWRGARAPVSGGRWAAVPRSLATEPLGTYAMETGTERGSLLRRKKP